MEVKFKCKCGSTKLVEVWTGITQKTLITIDDEDNVEPIRYDDDDELDNGNFSHYGCKKCGKVITEVEGAIYLIRILKADYSQE